MNNKVTVLIPFYNNAKYLNEAITSVIKQTYKNWEIILIDDGSTDNFLPKIKHHLEDRRISLISLSNNQGKSKALNVGLSKTDSDFIMELDGDDWLPDNALEIFVNEFQKQPKEVALLTGNVIHVYEKDGKMKNEKKFRIIPKGNSFMERYQLVSQTYIPYPRFYKTSSLKWIGGWPTDDPWEGRHVDDLFVFLRLLEHFKFHWIDEVLYYYRLHDSNQTTYNRQIIADAVEWIYRNALKRWGDEYEPIFIINKNGWKRISNLINKNK